MEQRVSARNPNRVPLSSGKRETLEFALQSKLKIHSNLETQIKSIEKRRKEIEELQKRLLEDVAADQKLFKEKAEAYRKGLNEETEVYQKKLNLDVNASRLASLEKRIIATEAQKSKLEPKIFQLKGLLHPIRRFPDNVLKEILQLTTESSTNSFVSATQLSHVCQLWRKLILKVPVPWSNITIQLRTEREKEQKIRLPTFWDSIIPRLGNTPVDVTITGHYTRLRTSADFSTIIPLHQIPHLKSVHFNLGNAKSSNVAFALFRKLNKPVHNVKVQLISSGKYEIGDAVSHADSFALVVYSDGVEIAENQTQYDNISELILTIYGQVNVMNLIGRCSQVERLIIFKAPVSPKSSTRMSLTFPNLLELIEHSNLIHNILDPSSSCPNLTSIELWGPFGLQFSEFLRCHPWVHFLSIDNYENLPIAIELLPNLKGLALRDMLNLKLKLLYSWEEYGLNECPFPAMIDLEIGSQHSPEEVEGIVNRRTEGPEFEPLRAQGVVPLQILKIKVWQHQDKEWTPSPKLENIGCEEVDTYSAMYTFKCPSSVDST